MVVRVFDELLGAQDFAVLQRFPSVFLCVESCIEHDAVRVQMRIQSPGGFVCECGADKVLGETV